MKSMPFLFCLCRAIQTATPREAVWPDGTGLACPACGSRIVKRCAKKGANAVRDEVPVTLTLEERRLSVRDEAWALQSSIERTCSHVSGAAPLVHTAYLLVQVWACPFARKSPLPMVGNLPSLTSRMLIRADPQPWLQRAPFFGSIQPPLRMALAETRSACDALKQEFQGVESMRDITVETLCEKAESRGTPSTGIKAMF